MSVFKTACPLDCYDACSVVITNDGKLKGDKNHPFTQGFLCPFLNHYEKFKRIEKPTFNAQVIFMDEALEHLSTILKNSKKTLHYRSHGNFGKMQAITDQFFSQYGAALTEGSLCDAAGEEGIVKGRGVNFAMSEEQIAKSDTVIFWGRNPKVTNSHILPFIKGKKIIVIDPVKTNFAKSSDLYLQIRPRQDINLALLLSQMVFNEDMQDNNFLETKCANVESFKRVVNALDSKTMIEDIDVSVETLNTLLSLLKRKKVAILVGVGVQKYSIGTDVLRAIDSFAATLGLFGKDGCGVSYLGSSSEGLKNPFNIVETEKESASTADFDKYNTLFIQGANPIAQMPSSSSVKNKISKIENIIYFGIYENESSKAANLVIPAKTFLEKDDIRTSYGHNYMLKMPKINDSDIGISEYDLASFLTNEFSQGALESEEFYINYYDKQTSDSIINGREKVSYANGFRTPNGKFILLDRVEFDPLEDTGYFLITSKTSKGLNSQFEHEPKAFLPPSSNVKVGDTVLLKSKYGKAQFVADIDDGLRDDCILIHSGTPNVNYLTPNRTDNTGKNAMYQEVKVFIV
jgi:anaerobic selenocysteine-containing dehydrogenase